MSAKFPDDFLWGCATASYQVEGAVKEDGRGPSIWDTFSHAPGRIENDDTGDVACDQYHRFEEDIRWLKWLGAKAYRFSIAWPRVFPEGGGRPNEKGIAYYERLVDSLLAAGIEPWPTLYHWDLPQALEDRVGGWQSRETAERFGDYAAYVAQRLSDRVRNFMTINEFACFTDLGYAQGKFAPGKKLPPKERNQVRHHALVGHGLALAALRQNAKRPVRAGLAENLTIRVPVIETEANIAAAAKATREANARFLGAVLEGAYSEEYLQAEGANAPVFTPEDMRFIGAPLDFVGVNIYSSAPVRHIDAAPGYEVIPTPAAYPKMNIEWLTISPASMYWGPRFLSEIWNVKEILVTENGCACADKLTLRKEVLDTDRIMFTRAYLQQAQRAAAEGYPLKGYFHWTLLDNFEWAQGCAKRFGLLYTNYETLERIPKLSAHWYREVIQRNALA